MPRVTFSLHALQAMFERNITPADVTGVLAANRTIERYPDDRPYPSRLLLGWSGPRPIHVVAADNEAEAQIIVITVYEPDLARWEPDFERRRKQ